MKMYPLIVIGAGAGGLVVAIGAAKAGKRVLLIEKGTYGGDCTNFGCIPSKSLIASAEVAHSIKMAEEWGVKPNSIRFQAKETLERTRGIIAEILSHEDPKALKKLGVDTLTGIAAFLDPHTLEVKKENGKTEKIFGRKIVIATGSSPRHPKISGLEESTFSTNETIFDLEKVPKTLAVIGGGPIGCELAQAFHRLGSVVTLIHHGSHLLKKEEIAAQKVIEEVFQKEGIDLKLNSEPIEVSQSGGMYQIKIKGQRSSVEAEHLLVATGRRPNVEALQLERVGIEVGPLGILVDRFGRTSQKHVFAIGDVAGYASFTHVAENEARTVLRNFLVPFLFWNRLDRAQAIPRVTYTDPEVASIGMSEAEAVGQFGEKKIAVYTVPFIELDRAITAGRTEGFVKVVTKKWSSKILGATIVAPRAGEMLAQVSTAMHGKMPLRKLASLIHPYPTYSLAIRKAADQWLTKTVVPALKRFIKMS